MAFDYKRLTETATEARKQATEAAKGDDGGTCNMDSIFLCLKRVNEEETNKALNAGGISSYKTTWMRSTGFMMSPGPCGQANSRVRACKAVKQVFQAAGYEVYDFCMMD